MRARLLIVAAALFAYGQILFNGAGLSLPDDLLAMRAPLTGPRALYGIVNHVAGSSMFVNLALHIACALLVYEIALRVLNANTIPAALAGLLFASHPLQADAVASVAGRSMLLCAAFSLSAVLVSLQTRNEWAAMFGATFLLLIAFACREDAVTIIPAILYVFYERRLLRRAAVFIMPLGAGALLAVAAHLVISWRSASAVPASGVAAADIISAYSPPAHFTLRYLEAMSQHFFPALFGIGLSVAPRLDASALWLIPLMMIFGVGALMYLHIRTAWILFLAPLAAYALMPLSDVTLEHRYYIATAGFSIIAGALIHSYRSRWLASVIVALLVVGSSMRVNTYRSMETLYADAVTKNPDDPRVRINHGMALYGLGDKRGARRELIVASGRLSLAVNDLADMEIRERGIGGLAIASRYLDLVNRIPEYHP